MLIVAGVTGKFPESRNVLEYQSNLLNKVDMVSEKNRRWGKVDPNVPQRYGQIPTVNKFDPGYFGMFALTPKLILTVHCLILNRQGLRRMLPMQWTHPADC